MHLAIALDVGPTGSRIARALHADIGIPRTQASWRLEFDSAAASSAHPEDNYDWQQSLHGTILCQVKVIRGQFSQSIRNEHIPAAIEKQFENELFCPNLLPA
jgi:hypothetical protein